MQRKLRPFEDQRSVVIADAEAGALAVTIRQDRTDNIRWLWVLVVKRSQPDVPIIRHRMIPSQPVGERALPVLRSRETEFWRGEKVDGQRFESTPVVMNDVRLDIPVVNRGGGYAQIRKVGQVERRAD